MINSSDALMVDGLQQEINEQRESKDQAYLERNMLVALLARIYPSGIRETDIDGWNPEWSGCVYIDLPTGQISYHYHSSQRNLFDKLPSYTKPYDGHTKKQVHERITKLMGNTGTANVNYLLDWIDHRRSGKKNASATPTQEAEIIGALHELHAFEAVLVRK